jgi:hypothetical protein
VDEYNEHEAYYASLTVMESTNSLNHGETRGADTVSYASRDNNFNWRILLLSVIFGIFITLHGLVHLLYSGQSVRLFELQTGMV